jgi:RNA polymerase sigma factor (sigma-70 family)
MNDMPVSRLEWIRSVMDEHQGRLIRFAARITGDLESARDVVQETFLRLCRQDPGRIADRVTPWLYTVCRNRALDVRRKEGPLMPLDEMALAALPARASDPAAGVEAGESSQRLLELLGTLPPDQQEVLRLRFQDELSYKEISSVTRHSISNVGFLIHVGLKQIRERLGASHPGTPQHGGQSHA